jgi:hypothetical protein
MRIICAAAMILILALPAFAQSQNRGQTPGPPPAAPKSQQEIEADRAAEQAYKKSLGNIPDQPPADPWGTARGTDAPKTAAKNTVVKKPIKTGGTAN